MPTVARSLLALCLSIPWAGALAACPGTQVEGAQTAPVAELSGLAIVPSDAFATGDTAPEAVRVSLGIARDRQVLERALQLLAALLARRPAAASTVV